MDTREPGRAARAHADLHATPHSARHRESSAHAVALPGPTPACAPVAVPARRTTTPGHGAGAPPLTVVIEPELIAAATQRAESRPIPGMRRLSRCERLHRGFFMGLRDTLSTSAASVVRIATGVGLAKAASRPLAYAAVGAASLLHLGVLRALHRLIGPIRPDASPAATEQRLEAEADARRACHGMALLAASMLPAVALVERSAGTQTAMNLAIALVMQTCGNVARESVNYACKPYLPPTTLELTNPRRGDDPTYTRVRLDWVRRCALVVNTLSYLVILMATGALDDLLRNRYADQMGKAGTGDFADFDYWLKSTALSSGGIYILAETLDQWAGQLFSNLVQATMGVTQYGKDETVAAPAPLPLAADKNPPAALAGLTQPAPSVTPAGTPLNGSISTPLDSPPANPLGAPLPAADGGGAPDPDGTREPDAGQAAQGAIDHPGDSILNRAVDPAAQRLLIPLQGWKAVLAEIMLDATARSTIVHGTALPAWLLRGHLPSAPAGRRLDLVRVGYFQASRASLALSEARARVSQMVSRCALSTLPNADSTSLVDASGFDFWRATYHAATSSQVDTDRLRMAQRNPFAGTMVLRNLTRHPELIVSKESDPDSESSSIQPANPDAPLSSASFENPVQPLASTAPVSANITPPRPINTVVIHQLPPTPARAPAANQAADTAHGTG